MPFYLTAQQTASTVLKLDGQHVSVRTLAEWALQGVGVPSRWPHRRGRFNAKGYSVFDLALVRLVLRLRRAGVAMAKVKPIIDRTDVRAALHWNSRAELVVAAGACIQFYEQGLPSHELPSGQARVPLAPCVEGIDEAVAMFA